METDDKQAFRVIRQPPRPSGSSSSLRPSKPVKDSSRPTGLFARFKRHLRRWWWVHAIIWILLILLIVLLIIYVVIKAVVQSQFNRATLTVISEAVVDPRPDSFRLQLNTQFESHTKFTPRIEGFNASLSLPDSDHPYGYFMTPPAQAEPVFDVNIDQPVQITNLTEFARYNNAILRNETVGVRIQGHTKVDLGALPRYDVVYDKTLVQKGLNNLQGFAVLGAKILSPPTANVSVITKIFLPNPTVLTVEMGNLTQRVYSEDDTFLGTSIVPDFTLRPGNNCFFAFNYIDTMLAAQSLQGTSLALKIVGDSTVNEQGQLLTYWSRALLSNVINYTLNLTMIIGTDFSGDCVAPS